MSRLNTKEDYQKLLLQLLEPLKEKFTPQGAGIYLYGSGASYPENIIAMEAFARPLWGLAPFWAGGGRDEFWEKKYQKGLLAGTDPKNPEYWGECEDFDQRFVEMGPISLGLLMAPHILWEPFSQREKENIAAWLYQINHHTLSKCNWYYFRILVNLALKTLRCPYSPALLKSDLEYMESCYLGHGWYVDGISNRKDYYSAFAMEFYSQIYGVYGNEDDKNRCARLKRRAGKFQTDFVYWFDEQGRALPYGRSLTYRFAQAAFWAAALFSGAAGSSDDEAGVNPGQIKGIINRNLRYWLSKEIFQGDGVLSIGYAYANLSMAEKYNAPGSPYWCFKVFLILALSSDHPYWREEELPLPKLDFLRSMSYADILIQHCGKETCGYTPAIYIKNPLGYFVEKYGKFAYSTEFGFSVSHSGENLEEAAPDSMLAFAVEGEQKVYVRTRSISYEIGADYVVSQWSPVKGITVTTRIRPTGFGHVREHEITSAISCKAYECGFAVAKYLTGYETFLGSKEAEAKNHSHLCKVVIKEITPERSTLYPMVISADPNTNILYKNTVIPAVAFDVTPGTTRIISHIERSFYDNPGI